MRREELYLSDILETADAIEKFLADIDKDAFINSDLIRSAVLQKLTIIGEATARLPKTFKERNKDMEWADIIAFRNLTVHAYFSIDWSIVWTTAAKDVPEMKLPAASSGVSSGVMLYSPQAAGN
jgi:uncharacterized protein with HEPN domain